MVAKICVFLLSVAKALKSKKPVRRVFDGLLQFLAMLFASVPAEREGFEPLLKTLYFQVFQKTLNP
jgi:hypothetical protein